MTVSDTDRLLDLVRIALHEIDDRPLAVTARRVARLASLMGESELAVRLGLELKSTRGHPPTNAEETRRLLSDPSTWGDPAGPAERALTSMFAVRRIDFGESEGLLSAHSLHQLEELRELFEADIGHQSIDTAQHHRHVVEIIEAVRHTCFTALVSWERQLTYSNLNLEIFERFRSAVDAHLTAVAPAILEQFSAVHRRLREAATTPKADASEEVAQAVTSCRRILKAVADHLLPGEPGAVTGNGHKLDDSSYKNRLFEFIKTHVASDRTEHAIRSALGGVFERFDALDALASKGVHADVGLAEAEMCAIGTYLAAGELLRLLDVPEKQSTVPTPAGDHAGVTLPCG